MTSELQFPSSSIEHLFARATGDPAAACNLRRSSHRWLVALILFLCLTAAAKAQTYYIVDCSGANQADFPTITSAVQAALLQPNFGGSTNTYVLLTTPCTENVVINGATNLSISAFYGQTVSITGNITVNNSTGTFFYGLNVTNPSGDAFDIVSSRGTVFYTCTANGSSGAGLSASFLSDVDVEGPMSFDNNGADGILLASTSFVDIVNWSGGSVDISNNQGEGVYVGIGSTFETLGNTTIEDNVASAGAITPAGYGIQSVAAGRVQLGNCFGANQISGNQGGGFDVEENSELSIWACGPSSVTTVSGNGPVGISAGFGSQVTLYGNAVITGHTGSGVELYGKSQLHVFGTDPISQNGSAGNPRSAGIVVDGNSEAYLRGGQLTQNIGPGILALVNSSVDFTGVTFNGNSGGIIDCDSSAYMVSDLEPIGSWHGGGINCSTPHNLGNRHGFGAAPRIPNLTSAKARTAVIMAQIRAKQK